MNKSIKAGFLNMTLGIVFLSGLTACTNTVNKGQDAVAVSQNTVSPIMIRSAETINAPLIDNDKKSTSQTVDSQ
ncbi:hypothetical protein [Psychrobacter sanguinis]|uniref:hypothetical protein n=1 Tax=Psychrobacter sanguinis TaxID=861445 RepID=UPI0019195636|nr:hypothetical protein [Psychrobacter sanguinis]MCC3344402.1 hypothetical protein [Psychrobacter sanguinis]